MTTPVRLSDAHPDQPAVLPPYTPAEAVSSLGWLVMTVGAIGMLLSSWILFGAQADGMWAGYRCEPLAMIVLLAALALRSSLAKVPSIGIGFVCGIALVLFGALVDDPIRIVLPEILFGLTIIVGSALQLAHLND